MAKVNFNLSELFEHTFGYKTQAFEPHFDTLTDKAKSRDAPYYAQDALGNHYFLPVTITYPNNNGGSERTEYQSWQLPYPVITINSKKTLVETVMTERNGTVKEFICIRDYEIVIKGFIIGEKNEFPEKDIKTLRSIYEQNTQISISCPLTDIFLLRPDRSGSDEVVITELNMPEITGVKNIRPYELKLLSNAPFNLVMI